MELRLANNAKALKTPAGLVMAEPVSNEWVPSHNQSRAASVSDGEAHKQLPAPAVVSRAVTIDRGEIQVGWQEEKTFSSSSTSHS